MDKWDDLLFGALTKDRVWMQPLLEHLGATAADVTLEGVEEKLHSGYLPALCIRNRSRLFFMFVRGRFVKVKVQMPSDRLLYLHEVQAGKILRERAGVVNVVTSFFNWECTNPANEDSTLFCTAYDAFVGLALSSAWSLFTDRELAEGLVALLEVYQKADPRSMTNVTDFCVFAHNALAPQHILVNPETHEWRLIDLGDAFVDCYHGELRSKLTSLKKPLPLREIDKLIQTFTRHMGDKQLRKRIRVVRRLYGDEDSYMTVKRLRNSILATVAEHFSAQAEATAAAGQGQAAPEEGVTSAK
eukprot:m51a1_g10061 hypothetical protein (301) ;mRNA; f:79914-80978